MPGTAEKTVTANVRSEELPQVFVDATVSVPFAEMAVTLIVFVVEEPLHPPGKVHEYPVAPVIAAMVYVAGTPLHILDGPEIDPGWVGGKQLKTVMVPFMPSHACGVQT